MTIQWLLMGAQAAGMLLDASSQRKANRWSDRGRQLDEAEINLRMNQERLQFEQESLSSLENLREVMASQRAMFAAQGRMPGVGSTRSIEERSKTQFTNEERARGLSQGFREHYLKSQVALSQIGASGKKAQQGMDLFSKSLNMFNPGSFQGFLGDGKKSQFKSPLEGLGNG